MITPERLAFDINIAYERIQGLDKEEAIDALAKDWSGFAWEYGLKNKLRFTPFEHRYYQCHSRMVCEEDLNSGTDFLSRIDSSERNGLIFEQSKALEQAFLGSKPGDTIIWASPKSDIGEGFSDYSFVYFGQVRDSKEGKELVVKDFLNDLNREDFNSWFDLDRKSSMEDLVRTIKTTDLENSNQVWEKIAETSPTGRIFDRSLNEVLSLVDEDLMNQAKLKSRIEAKMIYLALESGVSTEELQKQIGQRLINFVIDLTGESFASFSSSGGIDGSCGRVDFGSGSSAPEWVSYNSMTGEFKCKLCDEKLKRSAVKEHRCKC